MLYKQFLIIHTILVDNADRFASFFKIISTRFLIEHKVNILVNLLEKMFDLFSLSNFKEIILNNMQIKQNYTYKRYRCK